MCGLESQDLADITRRSGTRAPWSRANCPTIRGSPLSAQGSLNDSGRNSSGCGRYSAEARVGFSPNWLATRIWGIDTISGRSASRSPSAIAQLLVPRSMPRLKRAVMETGVLIIWVRMVGPVSQGVSFHFHLRGRYCGERVGGAAQQLRQFYPI